MGNSNTKSSKINPNKLPTINHPILQFATHISNNNIPELQLIIATPNQNTCIEWQNKINQYRIPYLDSQVLFLPKSVQYQDAALCGSEGIIKAIYNSPPLLLSQQLDNRVSIKQPFFQPQIWYLLYVLIYAASQIHKKDLIIGDIRPKNIFLFENGEISISCLASFLDETPNYTKSLGNKQPTYLAPEQIDDLVNHKVENQNPQKCEDFSIGLTLLGLMLLHDEQKLYFLTQSVFQVEKFAKQLSSLANCQIYSVQLKKIVLSLLQAEVDLRISSYQILKILRPHVQKILHFEDFCLDFNILNEQTSSKLNTIKFSDYKLGSSSTIMRRINEIQQLDGRISRLRQNCQQQRMIKMSQRLPSLVIVPGIEDHFFRSSNYKSELNETKKQEPQYRPKQLINNEASSFFNESESEMRKNMNNFAPQYNMAKISIKNNNRGSKSVQNYNLDEDEGNYNETKSNMDKNNQIKYIIKQENADNSEESGNGKRIPYNFHYSFKKKEDKNIENNRKFSTPIYKQKLIQGETNSTDNRSENMLKDLKKLEQMGRQAKSIKNPKIAKKPHMKIDYETILKNIDEQVKSSREKFPNQSMDS